MTNLRLRTEARCDLREIAEYLRRESGSAALGRRFLFAAQSSLIFISDFPMAGLPVEGAELQFTGLRAVIVKGFEKYLIYYRPGAKYVVVLRILHGARDVRSLLYQN